MQFKQSLVRLAFILLPVSVFSQTTYLPQGDKVNILMERLEIKNRTDSFFNFSKTKPFSRKHTVNAVTHYLQQNGLLSNINVVDNIAKGESYFFNEVQRIKNTIEKINDGKKWLVLIDELFKGTNVQDAMKCSLTVIKGLIKIKNSLFILSTHLYEIGDELKNYPNISFRYFETDVNDDQLKFSYQLKEGISNDRIGYVILKREKVVEMLEKL